MNTQKAAKHALCRNCHLEPTNGIYVRLCPAHAAATELLAALREAQDALNGKTTHCVMLKIEAAISKAEGR